MRHQGKLGAGLVLAMVAAMAGCTPSGPNENSAAYVAGKLGNGGFTFKCDESVTCDGYNDAKTFPTGVAAGSTFSMRYLAKNYVNGNVNNDGVINVSGDSDPSVGVTLKSVGGFLAPKGAGGQFSAEREGFATVVAMDGSGVVQDFVSVHVQKPDGIAVAETSSPNINLTTLTLKVGESKTVRAVGQKDHVNLAGALNYDWTADNNDIATVVQTTGRGEATVTGNKAGDVNYTLAGGGFSQTFKVTVSQ